MKLGKKLLAICVALIAIFTLSICAPSVSAASIKGSVTATKLNVRSGPGKTYKKVGSLKKGTSITVISTKGAWKKVQNKNVTGYVYSKYLKVK